MCTIYVTFQDSMNAFSGHGGRYRQLFCLRCLHRQNNAAPTPCLALCAWQSYIIQLLAFHWSTKIWRNCRFLFFIFLAPPPAVSHCVITALVQVVLKCTPREEKTRLPNANKRITFGWQVISCKWKAFSFKKKLEILKSMKNKSTKKKLGLAPSTQCAIVGKHNVTIKKCTIFLV